jgi:hypothetical protein
MKGAKNVWRRAAQSMGMLAIVALLVYAGGVPAVAATGKHAAIVIQSDADFASCGCMTSGSGTTTDPYIIGPWSINNVGGNAVYIDGSTLTKSFTLFNLTIAGNGTSTDTGIVLNHINPSGSQIITAKVYGVQTSIQTNNIGIQVENSSYVTLDGAGANPNGPGIAASGAGTINKNASGAIDVESSSHVTVTGWQMSANGVDGSPDWVAFDPAVSHWAVGGIRFFGVTDSTIDHNAANNDTSISYSLFASSHNMLSNNTSHYPFTMNYLLTDGSSYNTVTGNQSGTGDFIDMLVADPLPGESTLTTYGASHDNLISGNQTDNDGPIGNEVHAGIVPAFLGAIVVLNGTYSNTISNNAIGMATGGGLVWAQAVPSNTSIGVVTYPPVLHCNVTASEGGGGIASLNGNVWVGNTSVKPIDPCIPAQ